MSGSSVSLVGAGTCTVNANQPGDATHQAAPQVVPAVDLVHRLVVDDLLEQLRRRIPVDPLQLEEARVEPARQQVLEIGGERKQLVLEVLFTSDAEVRAELLDGQLVESRAPDATGTVP